MIKKVLIFFVLVSLVVILTNSEWEYAGARGQAPPRDYSDEGEGQEQEQERTRGFSGESVQQQPPRDYGDEGEGEGQDQEQEPTRGYPPQR